MLTSACVFGSAVIQKNRCCRTSLIQSELVSFIRRFSFENFQTLHYSQRSIFFFFQHSADKIRNLSKLSGHFMKLSIIKVLWFVPFNPGLQDREQWLSLGSSSVLFHVWMLLLLILSALVGRFECNTNPQSSQESWLQQQPLKTFTCPKYFGLPGVQWMWHQSLSLDTMWIRSQCSVSWGLIRIWTSCTSCCGKHMKKDQTWLNARQIYFKKHLLIN